MYVRKSMKVVNLATALGALAASAAAPAVADTAKSDEARIAENLTTNGESETKAEAKLPRGEELMSFTVHRNSDGMMVPQHGSHASHSSHSSHVSHASSSGSYGSDDDSGSY
jgi:hypothetical protein